MIKINKKRRDAGFTLLELLTVVGIIGLMASIVMASTNNARMRGRDAKRQSDMLQIQTALDWYLDLNSRYPDSDNDGCGSWDVGNRDLDFISGGLAPTLTDPPEDAIGTGNCSGYRYYRFAAGSFGCDTNRGPFYVLGVTDMESLPSPHPDSPGFSCPGRDFQTEMDWVTGKFEL